MKRLESLVFFYDEPWARVYTVEPCEEVRVEGIGGEDVTEHSISHSFRARTKDPVEIIEVRKDADPVKFVTYLHQGISGSHFRASRAQELEEGEVFHWESQDN